MWHPLILAKDIDLHGIFKEMEHTSGMSERRESVHDTHERRRSLHATRPSIDRRQGVVHEKALANLISLRRYTRW